MRALVFDRAGVGRGYDIFTVGDAAAGVVWRAPDEGGFTQTYGATAFVSEVVEHAYYLDRSVPSNVRLMRRDGRSAFPLVDGIRDLRFTYFADPDPMSVSAVGAPAGTCAYAAGSPPRPLLSVLAGQSLAQLSAADLTDGPFCGLPPNRFDADLLRIRRVRVSLRVRAVGSAPSAESTAFEMTFDVAPRNLNAAR
jgi:hypothetical protein